MRFYLIAILFLTGCAGQQLVFVPDDPAISNPFESEQDQAKEEKGLVVKRSYGLNAVEVTLPEQEDQALIRYPLAELKQDADPDPSAADHALEKTRALGEPNNKAHSVSKTPAKKKSYLLGISKIKKLYRKKEYELALIHIEPLLNAYPNDVKLLSLRGTISARLQYYELAKESWQRALLEDPTNKTLKHALQGIKRKVTAKK